MSKKKTDEKTVDATVAEDSKEEDVLTTENAENEEPVEEPQEDVPTEPEEKKASEKKKTQDEEVLAVGKDVPNVAGPSVVMVNRAAIVFLAKQLMTPPDLEDFKTLYPSLF
jgi:hypothetical protein